MLRRTPKPPKSAEGKDQSPFQIWTGFQHLLRVLLCHEKLAGFVGLTWRLHIPKGVFLNDFPSDRGSKELLGPSHGSSGRAIGVTLTQPKGEFVAIARANVAKVPVSAEELHESALCNLQVPKSARFGVRSPTNISFHEIR